MKIKLTQPGFEGYTGQMGILQFVDGLSTTDVPFRDAARMSAVMVCEFEDGSSCNPAQRLLDTAGTEAPVGRAIEAPNEELTVKVAADTQGGIKVEVGTVTAPADGTVVGEVAEEPVDENLYTMDDLSAIADAKGINGLREVAGPLGIKSNSITGLIDELLKAKATKKA